MTFEEYMRQISKEQNLKVRCWLVEDWFREHVPHHVMPKGNLRRT